MAKFYDALVALPSKSFGVLSGVVGIPAAFWPTWFEEKVGAKVNADTIQTVGIILMAAAIVYFALLWWLKPSESEGARLPSQSSTGANSPNIGSASGPITINYAPPNPPATQERKDPYGFRSPQKREGWTEDGLNNLQRVLLGNSPKPDLPLNGLLVRVYTALGGAPENPAAKQAFYRKVDLEIADAVVENGMTVWGRLFDRPRERLSMATWRNGRFNHRQKRFESVGDSVRPLCYTDLMFNSDEVKEVWPDDESRQV